MKQSNFLCKALACLVALTLFVPVLSAPVRVYAADYSDISGHWAEKYIKTAVTKGITKGYSDGTFKPDKPVTRAEFSAMINKALGNTGTSSISFSDIPSTEWYYNDVTKAVAASYVSGYADNSFKPNNPISREEASVMISRIVPSYGVSGNLRAFDDNGSISDWAYAALQKVNGKGYIGAYSDGKIHPKDQLTRAQTVKIICDIIEKESIVSSDPVVKTSGTTLSGKIYSNGVTIHKDLADNNATIDNCVIMGNLTIQGGGSNSVVLSNSRIASCSVAKSSSSVRVVAKGETFILNTDVSNTAKLETSNLSGGNSGVGFSKINVNASSDLTLGGSFPNVNLVGSSSNLKLESGTISTLDVNSSARNSKITLDSNGSISTANVNGSVSFYGKGSIQTMNANADSITYETKPSRVNIGSGVSTKPAETDAVLSITFDPADGDKNIAINKKITLTFSQAITKYNGKAISDSDLKDLIKLTKDSKSGTEITYSGTINSAKKVVTITPDKNLTTDTKYYITIDRNVFKDENGNGNASQSISFTVGTGTVDGVTFSPANGATGVKTSIEPTISFDSAIETYSGSDITSRYLNSNIVLKKTNSSGSDVSFTASINSKNKVITITPSSSLSEGQKYYLAFDSKIFRTASDDKSISGQSVTWTVGSNIDVSSIDSAITRANNAKANVAQSSVSGTDVSSSTYWVTPAQMTTLNNAISTATSAKSTVQSTSAANTAASTLDSAVTAFNSAKRLGSKTNVDTSSIDNSLSAADAAKTGIVVASKSEEVDSGKQWVTQEQMTALTNAIADAKNAKSTAQSTDIAKTAAAKLDTAIYTFNNSKKTGTKAAVDKSNLNSLISTAQGLFDNTPVSSDGKDVETSKKWVSSGDASALDSAIKDASKIANNASASQSEVDSAKSALDSAISTFKAAQKDGGKTSESL